jgi:hypothetical protein
LLLTEVRRQAISMKMQVFKLYIDAVIFSAIMMCMIILSFLLAIAVRIGYGSNGNAVTSCVLNCLLDKYDLLCNIIEWLWFFPWQ